MGRWAFGWHIVIRSHVDSSMSTMHQKMISVALPTDKFFEMNLVLSRDDSLDSMLDKLGHQH